MSSGGTRLVLLHISDLHFCESVAKGHYWNTEATELAVAPHNRRGLLGSLLYDLRHEKIKPDLVIVSGDLLDRCSASGVPLAISFLRKLAEGLALPRSRVVIAPGNHDVRRDGDDRYALYEEIRQGLYEGTRPAFAPDTPAHQRVEHHLFESDLGVEIVAFNSCEELDASKQFDHGTVGIGQRDYAETLLQGTSGKGLFRIAVMHHHLESPEGTRRTDYSVMADAAGMRRWLAREKFSLALHGHQHVDWQISFEVDGWSLAVASAASAGVAEYGRKEWSLALAYQVIEVDCAVRGRRVRREYNPQTMEWADAGRGEDVQVLRFGSVDGDKCDHDHEASHGHEHGHEHVAPKLEPAPPSLTRLGRLQVKLQHLERAMESHRSAFRVQILSILGAAVTAAILAVYLLRQLSPVLAASGGMALLLAGSIAFPMRVAAHREVVDKLQFLVDGYRRCTKHWDDNLVQMLDERFHRLI